MNSIAAIASAFLKGDVLTIKTAFRDFGVTNLPREVGRGIERKFGVQIVRVKKDGESRWGVPCTWHEYRLPTTQYNEEGRKKMIEYVKKHLSQRAAPKTDAQVREYKQTEMWLKTL